MKVNNFSSILIYAKAFLFLPVFFLNLNKFKSLIPLNYRSIVEKLIKNFFFTKENINKLKLNFILSNEKNSISKDLNKDGYCYYDFSKCHHSLKFIDCVNKLFVEKKNSTGNKQFDTYDISYDLFQNNLDLLKNFFSLELFDEIGKYIKFKPILHSIIIMHSHKKNFFLKDSAQLFHSDYEDNRSVKIFINLNEVREENGPFTFIDKKNTELVSEAYNYSKSYKERRLEDSFIDAFVKKDDYKNNIGPKNFGLLVDSTACLHYGSRLISGERKLLQIYIVSPFCLNFNKSFYKYLNKNSYLSNEDIFFSKIINFR
jgi:hypothetical protein